MEWKRSLTILVLGGVLPLLPAGCGEGGQAEEPPTAAQKPDTQPPAKPTPAPKSPAKQAPAPKSPAKPTPAPQSPEGAGAPEKPGPEGPPRAAAALVKWLAGHGVHLDREKKQIWVPGKAWILNANLEYLAVGRKGARHESLLVVDCKPSALNAALLALGLKPGGNFQLKEKVPMPPREEVEAGKTLPFVLIHPRGPEVYLTVEWAGKGGKAIRHRAEELVLNLKTEKPLKPRRWVYFGSRMTPLYKGEPPVFIADFEENLISVCYMAPSNHLITIKHEHGLNQGLWWPNAELMPPRETPVRLYISLAPLAGE